MPRDVVPILLRRERFRRRGLVRDDMERLSGAIAKMQAALNVDASFGERFDFGDEGCGIDYDAGADDCLLLGRRMPQGMSCRRSDLCR